MSLSASTGAQKAVPKKLLFRPPCADVNVPAAAGVAE
eukprot:CAMPEP_0173324792 /NCGR_PEP_ID=MMETSP1144-20121109/131_1 /TAXON_ID=483371 /ORGANISM="non described non described, Strain CCMP2298" /LENGTH=36 /DNA_ID= /DNA_START= /DNA_END= /DNA_ORIENTATION=